MSDSLEAPGTDDSPDWGSIYRARGDEVVRHRPVFTGDIFRNLQITSNGDATVAIILQHPCAMRTDGVTLAARLLVAEVRSAGLVPRSKWMSGHYRQMPLPELMPDADRKHHAAHLDQPQLVTPAQLKNATRIGCLSQLGVNLLLQRWVHHNSRAAIGTHVYQEVTSPQFEEADIIEEWCIDREEDGISLSTATTEIHSWLRGDAATGVSPQELLKQPQFRSQVRKAVRLHLKQLRGQEPH